MKLRLPPGRRLVMGIPFAWLLLFFVVPFVIVLKISLSESIVGIPPYKPLLEWADDSLKVVVNFANFVWLTQDNLYFDAYLNSLKVAAISTVLCLLVGYPMAYAIARAPQTAQPALLLLIMLPSWTSFLIRIYAWIGILKNQGLLNQFLMWLGMIDEPLRILNTNTALYIGVVYAYLPFMILPLYANLSRHDQSLLEAASDLGARGWKAFLTVTLPLSKAGMVAGAMLVFIPVVGEFVIPELLGGPQSLMIGKVLWNEFFSNRDWPVAAALAVVMLGLLCLPIAYFNRQQAKELEGEQ